MITRRSLGIFFITLPLDAWRKRFSQSLPSITVMLTSSFSNRPLQQHHGASLQSKSGLLCPNNLFLDSCSRSHRDLSGVSHRMPCRTPEKRGGPELVEFVRDSGRARDGRGFACNHRSIHRQAPNIIPNIHPWQQLHGKEEPTNCPPMTSQSTWTTNDEVRLIPSNGAYKPDPRGQDDRGRSGNKTVRTRVPKWSDNSGARWRQGYRRVLDCSDKLRHFAQGTLQAGNACSDTTKGYCMLKCGCQEDEHDMCMHNIHDRYLNRTDWCGWHDCFRCDSSGQSGDDPSDDCMVWYGLIVCAMHVRRQVVNL